MLKAFKLAFGSAALAAALSAPGATDASAQEARRPFCRPHTVTVHRCIHHRIWVMTYRVHFNCSRTLVSRHPTWRRCHSHW